MIGKPSPLPLPSPSPPLPLPLLLPSLSFYTNTPPPHSLSSIQQKVDNRVQIVLHGTNEFIPEILSKCIERGVTRVNVNKMVLSEYFAYTAEKTGKVPLTEQLETGTDLIKKQCEYWIDHMGCAGKAGSY
jgi:fructose-bisphosphate aldolase class II